MYPRIVRLNIDSTNETSTPQLCGKTCNLARPIVSIPEEYDLIIEKAEIPISMMPINMLNKHHYIMIDYPPGSPAHPVLEEKLNIFSIYGEIKNVDDLLYKVNKILTFDLLPSVSLGTFSYDRSTERIEFKFGTVEDRDSVLGLGIEVWFDERIMRMLDGIPRLYSPNHDPSVSIDEARMYKLDYVSYLGSTSGTVFEQQTSYQIPKMFGFKSIRIFSTLPTFSYFVNNPDIGGVVPSKMLTEFTLNSVNYNEAQTNQIYIPSTHKPIQLTGGSPIDCFDISIMIHYKNGKDYILQYAPGEYLSLTLCFQKYKQ